MMDKQNLQQRAGTKDRRYLGYLGLVVQLLAVIWKERTARLSEGYNWVPANELSAGKTL